jgi:MFS transporter, DHA2 family, multidrug resistance protein
MNKWLVSVTVMLPTLIEIVDTSVVNVSLDHIRGSLSAGIDEATWTITAYLVSNAIVIPMTGWLSRFFGRKRYLIFSVSLFTVSSFLCGAAWNLQSLVVFRVLQGMAGGALQPISQSILLETFPPAEHGMAMAIFGVGVMFGPIIGPLLGGWITDHWSWHWIFFINVPIGAISLLLILLVIVDPPYMERMKMKVDYTGLFLLAAGLGCLQVVLDKGQREDWFSSGVIIWLSVIAVSCLAFFIINELFAATPIVNLRVFRNPTFSSGNLIMFFAFFSLFGSLVLVPIYLQTLMGYTAYLAGLVLGPGGIAAMVAMPLAGQLINRVNPRYILAFGVTVAACAVYLMSGFSLQADFEAVLWPRILQGFGLGFLFIPLNVVVMSGIRKENLANASAIFNLLRNLGGSFGIAFATTFLARRTQYHQSRLSEHLVFLDRPFSTSLPEIARRLQEQGIDPSNPDQGALAMIQQEMLREASMLSFNDTFYVLAVLMFLVLPLVILMRPGDRAPQKDAAQVQA